MNVVAVLARLAAFVVALAVVGATWRLVAGVLGEPAGLATAVLVAVAVAVAATVGTRSQRLVTPYW